MKIKTILSFFSILLTLAVLSQESGNKGSYNLGFEGGIQLTDVNDAFLLDSKSGTGFNFGPYFEYYINQSLKLKVAAHFEDRKFELGNGSQYIVDDSGYVGYYSYYHVNENYIANYLTIPLSVVFERGSDKLKLFVQGTFYYSLLLNSTQSGDRYVYISEEDAEHFWFEDHPEFNVPGYHILEPDTKNLNTSDFGINAFIGACYNISPKLSVYISPGFTMSFANVWEDPSRIASWSSMYKFTAGISYKLK
jgi:hypothetical protein